MDSLEVLLAVLFALSTGVVVYAYVLYPLLIWGLGGLYGKQQTPPAEPQEWPTVSLLIVAYNEEQEIARRIENALALDYPRDRLEIVIASDGSTDRTADIVCRYAEQGVVLLDYQERRGKPAVLNNTVRALRGELVVFSDANSYIEAPALKKLIRWFQDPAVGTVCGRLILADPATGENVDSLYWKYETFLKRSEGKLGALLGCNGAIYALRRAWYPSIPDDTVVDDFVIPLQLKLDRGAEIVYESEAVAREETPAGIDSEFKRRARIGAGGFQAIALLWRLLHPRHGWTAFTFFNHKILRWISPFCLILAALTNVGLLRFEFFRWCFGAQVLFYCLAPLGKAVPSSPKAWRTLRLATMFVGMNAALLVGFFRWLFGTQGATWQRTPRVAEVAVVETTEAAR